MRIAEIFDSLQGEGPAMGRQATFVRLAGCNLRCEGCDTELEQWQELTPLEVNEKVIGNRVIITGGEPTLQMPELSDLIMLLHRAGKEIHIETNGTILISEDILKMIHHAVVSPKRGSDFHPAYWSAKENVHFKFVVGKAPWCWTSRQLRKHVCALPKERVWIMAFGTDPDLPEAHEAWNLALQLGVNYSDRLHIRLRRK
ncbi:MAG: 7-carboxy-7-deazaguanine synthase QueE [Methanothrix sp.]|nr:7-carboxy-7-deazaguanine synthase QueE [Methanothrix sp.]